MPGTLYLIGVPIGHPLDLSRRALAVLRSVDLITTEDPRATQALLRHYKLSVPLTSYGPTRIREKVRVLLDRLQAGKSIGLVSDCGMPAIADPGSLLIDAAHRNQIPIRSIPGPSAITAALTASGFATESFFFYGDCPARKDVLARQLPALLTHPYPIVMFSPRTSVDRLVCAIATATPSRRLTVACNLSAPNEKIYRGPAKQLAAQLTKAAILESVTVVIDGSKGRSRKKDY